jgi:hypothetical protein
MTPIEIIRASLKQHLLPRPKTTRFTQYNIEGTKPGATCTAWPKRANFNGTFEYIKNQIK